MNFTTAMGFVAGLLQFVVAGYALRLNRLFGVRRVGWSLFWAFLLLALLHLMQSIMQGGLGPALGVKVDVMNALISMLLLIGMVHLESLLKERIRVEREEQRMRKDLEEEVKKKTAYLMRAIEELQSEMNERKRMETEAQTARWQLDVVSRKAEMAQIAASVLQSVGEIVRIDLRYRDFGERHAIVTQHQLKQAGGRLVAGDDADALAGELRHFAELATVAAVVARVTVVTVVALGSLAAALAAALGALAAFSCFRSRGAAACGFAGCGDRGRDDQRHHVLSHNGDDRPFHRVIEIAWQQREIDLALAHRLCGLP